MLDDPYGKKDWAKTKTSPLFSFWKATLLAYGPDFGGEAFVAATERLALYGDRFRPLRGTFG